MIAALEFCESPDAAARPRVRVARFAPRSMLPIAAACVVAGAIREQSSRLLACAAETDLVSPVVPDRAAADVLFAGTALAVRGRASDAFLIVRPGDAKRIVALAFGEADRGAAEPLSEIELRTLTRFVEALVPACASLCGTVDRAHLVDAAEAAAASEVYFEVRVGAPASFTIGIGVGSDPPPERGEPLALAHLANVPIGVRVRVASGRVILGALHRLVPGETIVFETGLDDSGVLRSNQTELAYVDCGARGERRAARVAATAWSPA